MIDGQMTPGVGMLFLDNELAMQKDKKLTEAEKEKLMFQIRSAGSMAEKKRLAAELTDRMDESEAL